MAGKLIQIYYDESQKSACYPFADLYFNQNLTIHFENSCIKELVLASTSEKTAVCSWRLKEKMRYYIGKPRELTQEVLDSDYDVLSFTKNTKHHQMLDAADHWHKGFRGILTEILEMLSIKMPREVKIPIYQNHFSARTDIYQDYVKTYLIPVMNLIENDPHINELAMKDSNYATLARGNGVSPEYLKENIGVGYYPLVPFLLERLFSIYVHNRRINVTPL